MPRLTPEQTADAIVREHGCRQCDWLYAPLKFCPSCQRLKDAILQGISAHQITKD